MDKVYSVAQINAYIKNVFANDYALNNINIKGEISNCKYHTSGHIYFTLKDTKSVLSCVMFASQSSTLPFKLKEGLLVIASGSVGVYERDGKYQLYVNNIKQAGLGNLYEQFEELKNKLEKEGIFSQNNKKSIPKYPKQVGIVTAKTGAVIKDIVNVSTRRNPYVQLILYPAVVQGDEAPESIIEGIKTLDAMNLDTIIIGRGGGSIEDLWAFNNEKVVREIFNCKTPIISAVGHETDITLADFVSDLRAPTPSAAAELCINDIKQLEEDLKIYNTTLNKILKGCIIIYKKDLEKLAIKLSHNSPEFKIREKKQYIIDLEEKINNLINNKLNNNKYTLALLIEKLNGLSPLNKLQKGYALITNDDNKIIKTEKDINVSDTIKIHIMDGELTAIVKDKNNRRRC